MEFNWEAVGDITRVFGVILGILGTTAYGCYKIDKNLYLTGIGLFALTIVELVVLFGFLVPKGG